MSLRVIIAETEEEKRLSYRLRFDIMCQELGWIPAQNYAIPEELDEYDITQSMIFLAIDDFSNAIGTSRLILPGEIPFPIEKHFVLHPMEQIENTYGEITYAMEVSRFIIPQNPAIKNHEITKMLCMEMLSTLLKMGATHAFISADYRFFRLLNILGFDFAQIGEPKIYMGSKTIPGITNLKNLALRLEREKPHLYELLTTNKKLYEEMASV